MKIERISVLAKFDNGKVHQILINQNQNQEQDIIDVITASTKDGTLKVAQNALEGIEILTNNESIKTTES